MPPEEKTEEWYKEQAEIAEQERLDDIEDRERLKCLKEELGMLKASTNGHADPCACTRTYNGIITGDQMCWISQEIRRAIETSLHVHEIMRGRSREIVTDAIIEGALIEIADLVNMKLERSTR